MSVPLSFCGNESKRNSNGTNIRQSLCRHHFGRTCNLGGVGMENLGTQASR